MRYSFIFGSVVLMCSCVLSIAQTSTSASAPEALPKVCSQTNPPPCATPPRVVSESPPRFSKQPGTNVKGVCVLTVVVEPNGHASHFRVTKGLRPDLDEEAIHAVKNWKFKPAMLNGKPVAVEIAVQVAFDIR